MERTTFLVPLRRFDTAKVRLRAQGAADVSTLARALASAVILACTPRTVVVVCESDDVEEFARAHGVMAWRSGADNLNAALQGATEGLEDRYDRFVVVPGDLRYPEGLSNFEPSSGVTLVADHRGLGTNLLGLPARSGFRFAFGPDSARRHRAEAARLGLPVVEVADSPWRFDVDGIEDLHGAPDSM